MSQIAVVEKSVFFRQVVIKVIWV